MGVYSERVCGPHCVQWCNASQVSIGTGRLLAPPPSEEELHAGWLQTCKDLEASRVVRRTAMQLLLQAEEDGEEEEVDVGLEETSSSGQSSEEESESERSEMQFASAAGSGCAAPCGGRTATAAAAARRPPKPPIGESPGVAISRGARANAECGVTASALQRGASMGVGARVAPPLPVHNG